jgi:hypothetical protein
MVAPWAAGSDTRAQRVQGTSWAGGRRGGGGRGAAALARRTHHARLHVAPVGHRVHQVAHVPAPVVMGKHLSGGGGGVGVGGEGEHMTGEVGGWVHGTKNGGYPHPTARATGTLLMRGCCWGGEGLAVVRLPPKRQAAGWEVVC